MAISTKRRLGEFDVFVASEDQEELFSRLAAAIELIERYDARLRHEIATNLRRVLISSASGAHYLSGLQACRLGAQTVLHASTLSLAMTIVHEAMHARLDHEHWSYNPEERERVERACTEAEIAFAERVPGSENEIATVRELLATKWWEPDSIRQDTLKEIERLGLPHWIRRLLER